MTFFKKKFDLLSFRGLIKFQKIKTKNENKFYQNDFCEKGQFMDNFSYILNGRAKRDFKRFIYRSCIFKSANSMLN